MFRIAVMLAVLPIILLANMAAAESSAPPMIDTPKVLAGDYVDTSSIESIVHDLFKSDRVKDWTDEQKVLNFYHWYRRMVYPYRYMASDRRDVLKSINTAGFNLCGSQAAVVRQILVAAGYPCRVAQVNLGPEWGHTVWEVKYGDKWRLFDAMTAFYVLTRDDPPTVASAEEIKADPTLVTKAVEEGRCGPEYCYTARNHEITMEKRAEFIEANHATDVPWSLLVTKPGTIAEFWNQAATRKRISPGKEEDAYGARVTPNVLDIKLKANERYVRHWHGSGLWMKRPSFPNTPPQNMAAGPNETFDVVNYKYFEPYRQANPNKWNTAVYRSYGNGYLEWSPADAAQLAQGSSLVNMSVEADGKLAVIDVTKPAALVLPVKSPYAAVQIELDLSANLPEGAIATLALIAVADGKQGPARRLWSSATPPADGPDAVRARQADGKLSLLAPLVDSANPIYEYLLRFELTKAKDATVKLDRLKTTFQLNPMALPGLVPGENKVRVSAAAPGKISGGKLVVTYNWFDAPEWKEAKSHVKELSELPAEYVISLPAGDAQKLPRMQLLELHLKAE